MGLENPGAPNQIGSRFILHQSIELHFIKSFNDLVQRAKRKGETNYRTRGNLSATRITYPLFKKKNLKLRVRV